MAPSRATYLIVGMLATSTCRLEVGHRAVAGGGGQRRLGFAYRNLRPTCLRPDHPLRAPRARRRHRHDADTTGVNRESHAATTITNGPQEFIVPTRTYHRAAVKLDLSDSINGLFSKSESPTAPHALAASVPQVAQENPW